MCYIKQIIYVKNIEYNYPKKDAVCIEIWALNISSVMYTT